MAKWSRFHGGVTVLCCGLGAALLPLVAAGGDHELWAGFGVDVYETEAFSTSTETQFRFREGGYLGYYDLAQKFFYQVSPTWTLGLHPIFDRARGNEDADWRDTYRIALEANPRFQLGATRVSIRNRLELRWREGRGSETFNRTRHQAELSWKVDWLPGQTRFAIRDEIFYDLESGRLSANRFYPAYFSFNLAEDWDLTAFYMLNSSRGSDGDWSDTSVWGFGLGWAP